MAFIGTRRDLLEGMAAGGAALGPGIGLALAQRGPTSARHASAARTATSLTGALRLEALAQHRTEHARKLQAAANT